MTILHVTDFHFNKRWFDWLLHRAPSHDIAVMSGDLLDLASATPHRRQIEWVADWLRDYPRPLCVASGNHDLEWNDALGRWMPAYWLRRIGNPNLWVDGQRVELNGISFLNVGCATRPKGGEADMWVVHAAPSGSRVVTRAAGGDGGDPDLAPAVRRYAPRVVFSGHVHDRRHWRGRDGDTLLLNPGRDPASDFPNHILVNTTRLACQFVSSLREEIHEAGFSVSAPLLTEDAPLNAATV